MRNNKLHPVFKKLSVINLCRIKYTSFCFILYCFTLNEKINIYLMLESMVGINGFDYGITENSMLLYAKVNTARDQSP